MQSPVYPARVIAVSLALSAFAVAIVAGLAVGNPARAVLTDALVCMLACHVLGLAVGAVAQRIVAEPDGTPAPVGDAPASVRRDPPVQEIST